MLKILTIFFLILLFSFTSTQSLSGGWSPTPTPYQSFNKIRNLYVNSVNGTDTIKWSGGTRSNHCRRASQPCKTFSAINKAAKEISKNNYINHINELNISVAPGNYWLSESVNFTGFSVNIFSTDGYEKTIIDGGGIICFNFTLNGHSFSIEGLTIINCQGNGTDGNDKAGGIQLTCYGQDSATIKNCLFENNTGIDGGAIYNAGCNLNFEGTNIINNRAINEGGGFYCDLPSSSSTQAMITFKNTNIFSNLAGNGADNIYDAYKHFANGRSGPACNYSQGYLGNCTECGNGGFCYPTGSCFCQAGYYRSATNSSCLPCDPGTYSNTIKSSSCSPCSSNTYTPYYASTECIDCPINTTSNNGSYQCTPPQVNNFQSSYIGPTNFTVTWQPPSQFGVTSYKVSYALNGTDNWNHSTLSANYTNLPVNVTKSGTYKVRIQGINNQGPGVITEIVIKTLPPVAPDPPQFHENKNTSTSWEIIWKYPYDGGEEIIEYEIIYWRNGSQNTSVNVTGNSTSYTATDLLSGEYYVIGRSITATNSSSYSKSLKVYTQPFISPSSVLDLEQQSSTCDSILFSWTEPSSNGGKLILLYNIKLVGQITEEFNVSNTTFQANATNLLSGSYSVSIRAYNGYYSSYTSKTMNTSSSERPGIITNISLIGATSTSLDIEWEEPSNNGALINYYTIYFCEEGCTDWTTLTSITTSKNLTNLESGTYDIRISAENINGSGDISQNFTFNTQQPQVPSPVIDLYKQSGDTSWIDLIWSEPVSDGGRPIIAYEITYREISDSQYYNETSYVTQYNLSVPGGTYIIKVRANNSIGYSNYSNEINASTTQTGVPGQVTNVSSSNITSTNFSLSWIAPNENGAWIEKYIIYYGFNEVNQSLTTNNNETTYLMDGLLSGEYSIQIAAQNKHGIGLRSDLIDVQTLNATTPSQVQSLTATQNSSMISQLYVTWEPPLYNGGSKITGYFISYESESYGTTDSVSIGNYTEYTFNNVLVSNYTVNVTAQNEAGNGTIATTFCITEAEAEVPSQVSSLQVTGTSSSSITIYWAPSSPNGAPILGYNISAQNQANGAIYNYTSSASINYNDYILFVCDGLFTGTYTITVWAFNSVGKSLPADTSGTTEYPQTPGTVEILNATSDSPTSFELEWKQPDTGGSSIITYTIVYTSVSKGGVTYLNTSNNNTMFNVTGLLSGEYYVRMKAYNDIGPSSTLGQGVYVETLPPVLPTEVVNLTGTPDGNALVMEWLEPKSNGGAEIDYYRVSWNNTTTSSSFQIQKIEKIHLQDSSTNTANTTTTPFTITGLSYLTEYTVYVEPHNEIGYGNAVSISLSTGSPAPKTITYIYAQQITNTSINVGWYPPNSENDMYTLLVNESISYSGIMTISKRIDNLAPFTEQTIQIQSEFDGYQSNFSKPVIFKTSASHPTEVTGLKVESSSDTTVSVQWDAPDPQGSEISYYIIDQESSKGSAQVLSYATQMTLGDLSASTDYTIKVCAVNPLGAGPWSDSKTTKTKANTKVALGVGLGVSLGTVAIIAILVVVYMKRKFKVKLPPPPDFTPYMFGDIYDAEFSRRQKKQLSGMEELRKLVIHPDKKVIKALFSVIRPADADSLCRALIYLLENESQNSALDLIKERIIHEVGLITDPGTLFRSNSFASKFLAIYSKLYGLPYLYKTIGIEIYQICKELTDPVEVSEVKLLQSSNNNNNNNNKSKNPDDSDDSSDREINSVDVNRWRLLLSAQKVLYRLSKSLDFVPIEFREISRLLQKNVNEKFPQSKNISVGSFFFLRFVCPAITAPESYGLVRRKPSDTARRHLILVAKILQNVANGTNFREAGFEDLSVFITTNKQKAYEFFDLLASPVVRDENDELKQIKYPQNVVLSSLAIIHRYICFNKDRLLGYLEENDKELKEKLESMIETMGEPIRREFTKI
ncbi:fibronectin type iii domain-containing 3ba-related [Anaeramoeba ignava]|uniref:Fibronectin type iii domain-containing 3ba-related n=1 Tax=Anaeramoeba ignava TaxID=1746090 RepID=A0A9Q0LG96_ANAIG|nr:fibronectin type iii domain-containing 3ba-related [Anaeramoeba ignava]